MSDHRPYGILKRKDRDSHFPGKRTPPPPPRPPLTSAAGSKSKVMTSSSDGDKLLAGYMAYEFLTKGTVLGREFDPVLRTEVAPENKPVDAPVTVNESYIEITRLMMMNDGGGTKEVCISGVVNPTQVARWIKM